MIARLRVLLVALAVNGTCCAEPVPADTPARSEAKVPPPPPPLANGPRSIHSNTSYVEAMVALDDALWVATRGGLEEYDMTLRTRAKVYTTRDGLPTLHIRGVSVTPEGLPVATTEHHRCMMHGPTRRFACVKREPSEPGPSALPKPEPIRDVVEGVAVTTRFLASDGSEWLGTAGLGLWVREKSLVQRMTPTDQIASNHVVAMSEWNGSSWFATFDQGLSRHRNGQFRPAALGPRMLNDVIGTSEGLYVATSEGLYVSRDGEVFQRETRVKERPINDLAYDTTRNVLYATASNSLWEVRLDRAHASAQVTYQPGGSRSLQAVDVSNDGKVYLASEDRGVLTRASKRRFVGYDRLAGAPSSWAIDVLALGGSSALVGSLRHGVFPLAGNNPVTTPIDPWILFLGHDAQVPKTIFIGTQGGATLVEPSGTRNLEGLPNPCVHSMARLTSGLWVGTEGGLALY